MRVFLALLAVAASGCICVPQAVACLEDQETWCHDESEVTCVQLGEDGTDAGTSEPDCGGTLEDGTCAGHGFTVPCSGGYSVRPGTSCP